MQSLWEHIHSTIFTRQAIEQSGTGARSKRNRDKDDHEHGEEEHEVDERRYGGLGASLTVLSAGMGVESFAAESIGAAVNGFIRSRYEVGEGEETETKVHSTCAKAGFESLSESATSRAQPTLAAASQDPITCFVLVPSFQGGTATRRAGAALQKALNHRELMTRGRLNVIKRSETPQQNGGRVDEARTAHALGHRKSSFSPSMLAACTSLVIDASTHFECVLIQEGMDPKERCRGYFGKFAGGADNSTATTAPASASKQKIKLDAIRFELFQSENVVFDAEGTGGGGAGGAHTRVTVRVVLLPARTFCTDLLHKRIPIDTAVPIVLTMVRNVDEFFSPEDQESFRLDREDSGGAMRSGLAAHRASVVPLSRISSAIPPLAFALEMCSDSQFRQRQIIEAFVDRKTIHRKMKETGRAAAAIFDRNNKQDKDTSSRDRRNNHKSKTNELGANDDGSSSNSNENARLLKVFFSELADPPVPPPAPLLYPLIRIVTDSASVSTSLLCSNPRRLSSLHVLDKLKLHDGADALQLFPRFRLDVINYFESEEKMLRLMAAGSVESSGTSASPKTSKMPSLRSSSSAPSPPLSIKLKVETPPLPLSILSPFSARIATLLYTILEDLVLDLKREMNAMERRLSEEIHNRLLQRMFSSDAAAEDKQYDGGAKKAVGGSWRDALRTKKLQGGFFRHGDDSDTEDLATHGTANLVAGPAWDVSNNTNSKKSAAGALIGRNPSSNGGAAVREPKAPKIVVSVKGIALGSLSAFDLIAIPGLVVDGKSQSEAKEAENGAVQGEARKEPAHRNPSGKNVDENEDNDDGDDEVIEVAKKTNGAPLSNAQPQNPQPSSTSAVGNNAPKLRTAADTAATAAVAHNSAILLAELRAVVDKSSLPVVDHNDYYNLLGVTNSHNRTHFSPSAAVGNFPHQGSSRTSYLTQRPTLPMAVIAILRSILDVRDFFDFLVSTPDMPATTFLYKLERKLLAYRRLEYAFAIEMRWRSMHDPSMWAQIHPSVMGCNGVQLWTLSPHFAEVCALARQRVYITHENECCSVPVPYRHHQQERQTATATEPAGLNDDTSENSAHAQQTAHSSSSSSSSGVRRSGGGRSILITPNLSEEVGPRLHWLRQAVDDWARKQAENYLKTANSSYSLSLPSSFSYQKKRGDEGSFHSTGGGESVSAMPSLLVLCQRRASIRQITDLFNEGIEAVARRKFCGFLADYKHLHAQHEALGAYQQEQHEERTSASAAVSTTLNYSAKGGVLAAGGGGFGFGRGRGQQRGCGRGACNSRGARGAMSGPHKSPRADALSASNINKPLFGYSGGEGNTTKSTPSKFTGLSSTETSSKITPTAASHSTLKPPGVAMPATVVLCDSSDDDDAFDGFVGGESSSKTTTPAYDENAFLFVNQSGSASGATASKPKRTLLFGGGGAAAEDKSSASGDQNDEGNNVPVSNTDGEGGDHQSTTTKLMSVVPSASDESETDSLVEVLVQTKPNRNRNEFEASSPDHHHRTEHQQKRAMEEHQQQRRLIACSILAAAPSSSLFDDDDDDDHGRGIDESGLISGRSMRSRFVDRKNEIEEEDGANASSNKGKRGQQKKKKGEESGFGPADSDEEGSDTDAASDFDWESPAALEMLNKNGKVASRRSKSTSNVVKGGQKRARSESPNPALPAALLGREKSAGPSAPQLLENCFDLTGSRIDDIRESIISLTQLDDLHIYASNNGTILTTEDVSTKEECMNKNQQQSELANANSAGNATQQSILQCRGRSLSAYAAGIVSQVLCSSKQSRAEASTTPQRRKREYSVRQPDEELASQLTPIWGIVSALTAIAPPPSSGNEREGGHDVDGLNLSAAPPPLPPPIIRFRPKQPAAPAMNASSNNTIPYSSSSSSTSTAPNENPQPTVIRSNLLGGTSTSSSFSSIESGGGGKVRRTLIGGLTTRHGTTTTATTAVLKARQAHESLLALHDVGIMALASRPTTAAASPTVAGASSFSSHSSLISDALASATGNGKVKPCATSEKAVVVNRNELDLLRFLAEGTSTSDSSPYNQGIGVLSKLLADPTTCRVEILEKALFCSSSSASETASSSASQVRARATQLSSNNNPNPFDNIANDENHKSNTVVNLSQATDLGGTTEDPVAAISLPQHSTCTPIAARRQLGDNVIDLGQKRIPSSVLHASAHVLNRANDLFKEGSSTTTTTTTRATVLMSAAPPSTASPRQRGVVEILDSDEDGDDAVEILTPATTRRKEVVVERPQSPTHVLCDASVTYALQSVGQDAAVISVKLVLVESPSMSVDTETVEGKTRGEVRRTPEMKGRVDDEIIIATIRVSLNANVTCASMVELLSDQRFVPYTEEDNKEKCDKKGSVTAGVRRNGNIGDPPPSTAPRIRDPTRSRVDKLILFEPEASLLKTIEVVGVELRRKALLFASTVSITKTTVEDDDDDDDEIHEVRQSRKKDHSRTLESRPLLYLAPEARKAIEVSVFQWRPPAAPKKPSAKGFSPSASSVMPAASKATASKPVHIFHVDPFSLDIAMAREQILLQRLVVAKNTTLANHRMHVSTASKLALLQSLSRSIESGGGGGSAGYGADIMNNNDTAKAYTTTIPNSGTTKGPDNNKKPRDTLTRRIKEAVLANKGSVGEEEQEQDEEDDTSEPKTINEAWERAQRKLQRERARGEKQKESTSASSPAAAADSAFLTIMQALKAISARREAQQYLSLSSASSSSLLGSSGFAASSNQIDRRLLVVMDEREFRNNLPYELHVRGISLLPMTLPRGDFILSPTCAVERKSFPDLVGSLASSRLNSQLTKLTEHFAHTMVLIEDSDFTEETAGSSAAVRPFRFHHSSSASESGYTHSFAMANIYRQLMRLVMLHRTVHWLWGRSAGHSATMITKMKCGESFSSLPIAGYQREPQQSFSRLSERIAVANPDPDVCAPSGRDEGQKDAQKVAMSVLARFPGVTAANIAPLMLRCRSLAGLAVMSREEITEALTVLPSQSHNSNNSGAVASDAARSAAQFEASVNGELLYNFLHTKV